MAAIAKTFAPKLCLFANDACRNTAKLPRFGLTILRAISTNAVGKPRKMQTQVSSPVSLNNSFGCAGNIGDIHQRSLEWGECKVALYKEWASNYDEDVENEGYAGPRETSKQLLGRVAAPAGSRLQVLDAGCGTGLVGQELRLQSHAKAQAVDIYGCDISPDMLKLAEEKGYKSCVALDMNEPLAYESNSFDGVTCSGTFLQGHVGAAPALPELCRVVKPGGCVVVTVRSAFYDEAFEKVINSLKEDGHAVESKDFQYLQGVSAKLLTVTKRR